MPILSDKALGLPTPHSAKSRHFQRRQLRLDKPFRFLTLEEVLQSFLESGGNEKSQRNSLMLSGGMLAASGCSAACLGSDKPPSSSAQRGLGLPSLVLSGSRWDSQRAGRPARRPGPGGGGGGDDGSAVALPRTRAAHSSGRGSSLTKSPRPGSHTGDTRARAQSAQRQLLQRRQDATCSRRRHNVAGTQCPPATERRTPRSPSASGEANANESAGLAPWLLPMHPRAASGRGGNAV